MNPDRRVTEFGFVRRAHATQGDDRGRLSVDGGDVHVRHHLGHVADVLNPLAIQFVLLENGDRDGRLHQFGFDVKRGDLDLLGVPLGLGLFLLVFGRRLFLFGLGLRFFLRLLSDGKIESG